MALTTALAVISLATALRDIIELARNFCEAFNQAPRSFKDASNTAKSILSTATHIELLYQHHHEDFHRSPELNDSVKELYQDMLTAYEKCCTLLPPVSEKKTAKLKIAIYSMWNRKRIDDLVLEVRNRIDLCYKEFELLSSIRSELSGIRMETTIDRLIRSGKSKAAQENQGNPYLLLGDIDRGMSVFDNFLCVFPMLRTPGAEPVWDIQKTYIRKELDTVDKMMNRFISKHLSNRLSNCADPDQLPHLFEYSLNLQNSSVPYAKQSPRDNHIVILVLQLQSLLNSREATNISSITWSITSLAEHLHETMMFQEELTVRKWVVKMWKYMSEFVNSSRDVRINLIIHGTNLTYTHLHLHDYAAAYAQSCAVMEDTHRLSQCFRSARLRVLMADHLSVQALCLPQASATASKNIELVTRAVGTLEDVLGVTDRYNHISASGQQTLDELIKSTDLPPEIAYDSILTYTESLIHLSELEEREQNLASSLTTRKHALSLLRKLLKIYPTSRKLLRQKGAVLWSILQSQYSKLCSSSDTLDYAKEYTAVYCRLLKDSESVEDLGLYSYALSLYREALIAAKKFTDARMIYNDIVNLSDCALAQNLNSPQVPSITQGEYHYNLAQTHFSACRTPEAIQGAQCSITHFSFLYSISSERDPQAYMQAVDLLLMISCHSQESRNYQLGLRESYKMIETIQISSSSHEALFVKLLHKVFKLLEGSSVQKFFQLNTTIASLFQDLFLAKASDATFVYLYLQCLFELAEQCNGRRNHKKALDYTAQALAYTRYCTHLDNNDRIVEINGKLSIVHCFALCGSGRLQDALTFCIAAVNLSRKVKNSHSWSLVFNLSALSHAEICNGKPRQAIQTAMEMLGLCETTLAESWEEAGAPAQLRSREWRCRAHYQLSAALFDDGQFDEASAQLSKAVGLQMGTGSTSLEADISNLRNKVALQVPEIAESSSDSGDNTLQTYSA